MLYRDLSTSGLSARTPEILPIKYHDWLRDAAPMLGPQSRCPGAAWDFGRISATFRSQGKFLVNGGNCAGKILPKYCTAPEMSHRLHFTVMSKFRGQAAIWRKETRYMATSTHLAELEQRHRMLEDELAEALQHPSTDDLELVELKRRKLQLKDEITRLSQSASVH
jgi:hypothetical protein